ncbi:MAG TPA: type II toxin-antitoxin system VapC family toxin [Gammaproteobacteria bacterium]
MIYLLDTCVVSEFIKPQPSENLIAWLRTTDDLQMGISVITLGELQNGIARLDDGGRKERFQEWLNFELIPRFDNRILAVTLDDAMKWGELMGLARRNGTPFPSTDTLIAATALNRHTTVVTRNTKDFERIGVPTLNPWLALPAN